MSRKRLYTYTALLLVAIVGLLSVQLSWVSHALEVQNKALLHNARIQAQEIVDQLEDEYYCFQLFTEYEIGADEQFFMLRPTSDGALDTLAIYHWNVYKGDTNVRFKHLDLGAKARAEIMLNFEYFFNEPIPTHDSLNKLQNFIASSSQRYLYHDKKRILDTVTLREQMQLNMGKLMDGVSYAYSVALPAQPDSFIFKQSKAYKLEGLQPDLTMQLYEDMPLVPPLLLNLYLPEKTNALWKGSLLTILSFLFLTAVLVALIVVGLRSIIQEKRLASMKNELINNMTHEFNTPVTSIRLAAGSYKAELTEERKQLIIDIVKEENQRLQRNIQAILELSTAEGLSFTEENMELHELVKRIIEELRPLIEQRQAKVELSLEAKQDAVKGQSLHLRNAIANIIDNALKYGPVQLAISIKTSSKSGELRLDITDNGPGIPSEEQAYLFEKFYRGKSAKLKSNAGFGLGLYYAQRIIAQHGGRIQLKSETGQGSCFSLFLPLNNAKP